MSQKTVNGFPDNVGSMEYSPSPVEGCTCLHERYRGLFTPDDETNQPHKRLTLLIESLLNCEYVSTSIQMKD